MYCEHTCLAINYYCFFLVQGCIGIVKVGTFMYKGLPCPNPDDAKQSAAAIAISNLPVSSCDFGFARTFIISLSVSVSLSLSYTHTHTHTLIQGAKMPLLPYPMYPTGPYSYPMMYPPMFQPPPGSFNTPPPGGHGQYYPPGQKPLAPTQSSRFNRPSSSFVPLQVKPVIMKQLTKG